MGSMAATAGVARLKDTLAGQGEASIIVATGASQFEMLNSLRMSDLDWGAIKGFHLDEYIGLPVTHKASFRKYLKDRFVDKLPNPMNAFHYINGEGDPQAECDRVGALIRDTRIDVAFVGIGEKPRIEGP